MQISGQIMMSRAPLVLAQTGLLYGAGPAWRSLLPAPMQELVRGLPNFSTPDTLGDDIRSFLGTDKTPSFVLAFYSQPHFPYTSSPEFSRRYRVDGSSPSLAYGRDVTSDAPVTTDVDRRQVDALYRAALAETDAAIGKLLAELRKTGWLDDTIIVLTADHGEGLYECAECVGHGDNLRGMMTLRVPLAIRVPAGKFPNARPSVQQHYVSLLDVYPTITELVGLQQLSIMEGQPLLTQNGTVVPQPAITARALRRDGRVALDDRRRPEGPHRLSAGDHARAPRGRPHRDRSEVRGRHPRRQAPRRDTCTLQARVRARPHRRALAALRLRGRPARHEGSRPPTTRRCSPS